MPPKLRPNKSKNNQNRSPPDPNPPEEDPGPPSDVESVPDPRGETNAPTETEQMTNMMEMLLGGIQQLSVDIREGLRETMETTTEEFRELRSGLQDLQDTIGSTMDPSSMAQTLVEEIQRSHAESVETESTKVEPDTTPSNVPEEDTNRTDNDPVGRNEAPVSMFVVGRYPMYGKDASNNLGKYTKQLQLLPRAKGDDLRSLEALWDAHVNALNASVNSSNVLPAYKDLRPGFDIRDYMLGEPNSSLHTSAVNNTNMYGNALRTVLLGDSIVTIAHSPKLHDAIQTKATSMPSNCGFTLLQSAIVKLSPQLGGENTDIRAQIESFRPEDGEELPMYFRRGTGILRDSQLALLPNDSRNRLLRKWLEGLNSDQKFVSFVSNYLHHLKIHEKSANQSKEYRYTMEFIYDELTSRGCPNTISLSSVEDQVRVHFAAIASSINDGRELPTIVAQARYGRPPNQSERHPTGHTTQRRQGYQNQSPCEACGTRHPGGADRCRYRGPEFIENRDVRERVLQYNAQHGNTNPRLQELIERQATEDRVLRHPVLPNNPPSSRRVHYADLPPPPSGPSSREQTQQEDLEYPDDEADNGYSNTIEPYVSSAYNDDYLATDILDPPIDEDEYDDFFANPEGYFDTIDDSDMERRLAMSRFGTTLYERRIDDEDEGLTIEEISEDTTPGSTQVSLPTDPSNKPKPSTLVKRAQRTIARRPNQSYTIVKKDSAHCDGGANSHIAIHLCTILGYRESKSNVTMANGTKSPAEGYGYQLIRFPGDKKVYPLWPVYYMPNNEWSTLSTPALRVYNGFERASVHALESLEIIDETGRKLIVPTKPLERSKYHLDFVEVEFVKPSDIVQRPIVSPMTAAVTTRSQSQLKSTMESLRLPENDEQVTEPGKATKSPSNDEKHRQDGSQDLAESNQIVKRSSRGLSAELIHQRLGHVSYDTIQRMCKEGTIYGLPRSIQIPKNPCIVCLKAKATRIPEDTSPTLTQASLPTDPDPHLGTIDDYDVERRVAMVRFGTTSYERLINDEGQELTIEEIPEDTSPTVTQVSTYNLRPSQHLHMDLSSFSVTSVRSMNALMYVSDTKTRYLWTFPTRNKRPPIDICRSIYELLRRMGRIIQEILVDADGALANSSEFIKFWYHLGIVVTNTGGYASYLNGQVEHPNFAVANGTRAPPTNSNMPRLRRFDVARFDLLQPQN